jgi:hypothetical protein
MEEPHIYLYSCSKNQAIAYQSKYIEIFIINASNINSL